MKRTLVLLSCVLITLALACTLVAGERASLSRLPTAAGAKELLNSTHRHGEWHRIRAGSSEVLTWDIYPHATHVFLEFQDLGGNPEAVADAWPRAMAFIREHTK